MEPGWIGVIMGAFSVGAVAFREWRQSVERIVETDSKTRLALATADRAAQIALLEEKAKNCDEGRVGLQSQLDKVTGHLSTCNDQHVAVLARVEALENGKPPDAGHILKSSA